MCVDIEVTANGKVINLQKLTADATIDDKNGIIVAENRDAILNEIEVLSKNSQRIIESCDYHNEIVAKCNALVAELNPQLKREAEQAREINDLRQQLSDIKGMLADVLNKKTKEE
jgi:tRNA C32,U32 (ribose-2'-O)-methylase TrmJ